MRRNQPYIVIALTILFGLAACSGSKKAYKKAQEYEQAGLYVQAAEYDLRALREKPNFKEALAHLKQVAPKAFEELTQRANNHEAAGNWGAAVAEYKRLLDLLAQFNRHGIVLVTGNINESLANAKRHAAESHFAQAETLFDQKRWAEAGEAYLSAHSFVDSYNNSFERAIESFIKEGDLWLRKKDFSQALRMYGKVLSFAPGHPAAEKRVAESHYRWGRQYFKRGRFREALAEFEQSQKFVQDYKDAPEWAKRAYEEAVQYVGVFPFQNRSDFVADGYFIASEILARVSSANLKFVDFLPEASMNGMVNKLRRQGRDRFLEVELLDLARKEGLDAVVWGKIRRVRVDDKPESFHEYEHEMTTTVKDSAGKDVEEITTIYYREYFRSRKVAVDIEYFILETEDGKIVDKQRFRDDLFDEARWIAYQGSIYDLPENKRHYMDAPRDPRPPEAMIDELLGLIGKKVGREVVRYFR